MKSNSELFNALWEEIVEGFFSNDQGILRCELDDLVYEISTFQPKDGGIRATITVKRDGETVHRDTLALCMARKRAEFAKKVGDKGDKKVEGHLLRIEDELKALIQAKAKATKAEEPKSPQENMTEEELQIGLEFLRSPTLLRDIEDDLTVVAIVGESTNKLMLYIVGTSRKLDKPLHVTVRGASSVGKSHEAENVLDLFPPEEVKHSTSFSKQALPYLPQDAVKNKLVLVSERTAVEESAEVDYYFRELLSSDKITRDVPIKNPVTNEIVTETMQLEGPIAYIETTTSLQINPENATRMWDLCVDESEEQTQEIHTRQREDGTIKILDREAKIAGIVVKHHAAQRLLESLRVFVPYAEKISFPSEQLRTRRDFPAFLSLIKSIAFLHQKQREVKEAENGTQYIEANLDDYDAAYTLANKILADSLNELPGVSQALLEAINKNFAVGNEFTRRDIANKTHRTYNRVRYAIEPLVKFECLEITQGIKGQIIVYKLKQTDKGKAIEGLSNRQELEELLRVPF